MTTSTSTFSGASRASLKNWIKHDSGRLATFLRRGYLAFRRFEIPAPKFAWRPVYGLHIALVNLWANFMRVVYWTPLFKSRLNNSPKRLFVYSGMPQIIGNLLLEIGDDSRISGITTFSGRTCARQTPHLQIGRNVDVGWQCSIAVGTRVVLEDNVRIAGRCMLAGYPGHPLHAGDRILGLPETDDQVGDIVLENNVWLATDVKVMAGVTIGRNTVVAAGSVVTRDLPANVLAGGVPARIIRSLPEV